MTIMQVCGFMTWRMTSTAGDDGTGNSESESNSVSEWSSNPLDSSTNLLGGRDNKNMPHVQPPRQAINNIDNSSTMIDPFQAIKYLKALG